MRHKAQEPVNAGFSQHVGAVIPRVQTTLVCPVCEQKRLFIYICCHGWLISGFVTPQPYELDCGRPPPPLPPPRCGTVSGKAIPVAFFCLIFLWLSLVYVQE